LSSYEAAIAENANFDWSLSVLPHATEAPLVNVDGRSMTILSSTPKEQLAAWLFVKWLAEPSQQARWAQWMGCFPLSPSASEELDPAYLEQHDGYRLAVQLLGERWVSEPNVAGYVTCRAEVGRMLYAVTAGENADLWLSETATRCNQALETAIDR
jgi:ABC-type glycerol-3-phosphate transport system substrate-binding protein